MSVHEIPLSERAQRLMRKAQRLDTVRDGPEIKRLLEAAGVRPSADLVTVQQRFGGLRYESSSEWDFWHFDLFPVQVIDAEGANPLLCIPGLREAPFGFALDRRGQVRVLSDRTQPIATSPRLLLEAVALHCDSYVRWPQGASLRVERVDPSRAGLDALGRVLAGAGLQPIPRASDPWNLWWESANARASCFAWHQSDHFGLDLTGSDKAVVRALEERIKAAGLVHRHERYAQHAGKGKKKR